VVAAELLHHAVLPQHGTAGGARHIHVTASNKDGIGT
jgi:hypothetical protein